MVRSPVMAMETPGSMRTYSITGSFRERLRGFFRHGEMIGMLTMDELRRQYTRSLLGFSWLLVKPLLLIGLYGVLFGLVFQTRSGPGQTPWEYLLVLLTGLLPWLIFAEAISAATGAITANVGLVTKVLFPIEVLPVVKVLGTTASGLVGLLVLSVILTSMQHVGWALVLLPVLLAAQLAFMIGLAWILSAINVAVRDTNQVLPLALMVWMFLSPVVYTKEMVPQALATVFSINPMTYFLDGYRMILLAGQPPALSLWVIVVVVSAGTFLLGFGVFHRMRTMIADLV
jgi:lipopolysaccharide transport system permease protein